MSRLLCIFIIMSRASCALLIRSHQQNTRNHTLADFSSRFFLVAFIQLSVDSAEIVLLRDMTVREWSHAALFFILH